MTGAAFRQKLLAGEPIIGTWMKTPSPIIADVLGLSGLDCICLDAEHSPFDRLAIDGCIRALRAASKPVLMRTPSLQHDAILSALDCGANGIVAPHVRTVQEAQALVRHCHYGPGGRGYAGSSRAAGYTTRTLPENLQAARDGTAVIAQIEDLEAVEAIDEIAGVDGVDCLFIGRIDLTVALGAESPSNPQVIDLVRHICNAGKKAGRRVGMFLSDMKEIPAWRAAGASFFLLESDHTFLLKGAKALRERFDQVCAETP